MLSADDVYCETQETEWESTYSGVEGVRSDDDQRSRPATPEPTAVTEHGDNKPSPGISGHLDGDGGGRGGRRVGENTEDWCSAHVCLRLRPDGLTERGRLKRNDEEKCSEEQFENYSEELYAERSGERTGNEDDHGSGSDEVYWHAADDQEASENVPPCDT